MSGIKELELWQFIAARLQRRESVILLVVAESSGSSPGRQGYKMAVGESGELIGSIGGGVMEVNLVEESRALLDAVTQRRGNRETSILREQVHRDNSPNASGMICSGKQTVIFKLVTPEDSGAVQSIIGAISNDRQDWMTITSVEITVGPPKGGTQNSGTQNSRTQNTRFTFEKTSDTDFRYSEILGFQHHLYIIGGGHCALALSEVMSKMDFYICLFDDRPDLNTIDKNTFAHDIKIVDSYERISDHIPSGPSAFVVVMTLGYKTDELVIRSLIDKEFKYFGVLGSKAKMSAMFKTLRNDGFPDTSLNRIRTPAGLPINSRTPEEIAVSIAAEIISVKNG